MFLRVNLVDYQSGCNLESGEAVINTDLIASLWEQKVGETTMYFVSRPDGMAFTVDEASYRRIIDAVSPR